MRSRRDFLAALAALSATGWGGGCRWDSDPPEVPQSGPDWRVLTAKAIQRGGAFLWSQQDATGAFASQTYGIMALGQSLTPLVLLALNAAPQDVLPVRQHALSRAAGRMVDWVDQDGSIGFSGDVMDYPVYATAMTISALAKWRVSGWREAIVPMVAWLRTQQFRAEDGWTDHTAQGGFGMGSRQARTPPDAGHVDLSMTRRAVEALRRSGVTDDDPAQLEAGAFVARCQRKFGGFIYSPVDKNLNKGLRYEGYGSATTDGLLALRALGAVPVSPAVQRSVDYLRTIHRTDVNPGVSTGTMAAFAAAMRGYYRAGAAEVFAWKGGPEGWASTLTSAVIAEQQPDGSWKNESSLQKEDDPLIATAFAVMALSHALGADPSKDVELDAAGRPTE